MNVEAKVSTSEHTKNRFDVALLGEETAGSLSFRAQDLQPQQGSPLHAHTQQDETFHIISGEFRFIVADEEIFADEGTTLFVPRNTPHSILNIGSAIGKVISVLTPGINDGFLMNVPQAEKSGATNDELTALAKEYGVKILGPKQRYLK